MLDVVELHVVLGVLGCSWRALGVLLEFWSSACTSLGLGLLVGSTLAECYGYGIVMDHDISRDISLTPGYNVLCKGWGDTWHHSIGLPLLQPTELASRSTATVRSRVAAQPQAVEITHNASVV